MRASTANSLDAVGDRDFALDYLYALAALRDAPFASGRGFRFVCIAGVRLYDFAGRILDRQQPHAAKEKSRRWELLRGKTGRITGALVSLLVTLKGLPSSYQRDLQEDKEPVFAAHDQAVAMVRIAAGAVAATRFNEGRLREAASDPALLATEAAHYLVRRGVPFRQAHEIVGQVVREAERAGESLDGDAAREAEDVFAAI